MGVIICSTFFVFNSNTPFRMLISSSLSGSYHVMVSSFALHLSRKKLRRDNLPLRFDETVRNSWALLSCTCVRSGRLGRGREVSLLGRPRVLMEICVRRKMGYETGDSRDMHRTNTSWLIPLVHILHQWRDHSGRWQLVVLSCITKHVQFSFAWQNSIECCDVLAKMMIRKFGLVR
jgi:hypothetical protein